MALLSGDLWASIECTTSYPPLPPYSRHRRCKLSLRNTECTSIASRLQRCHISCRASVVEQSACEINPSQDAPSYGSEKEKSARKGLHINQGIGCNEKEDEGEGSLAVNGPRKKVPLEDLDEKERQRREKIGLANKGRTPWNKGKSHSAATIALMSARNKIVMQDPKIKEKLRQHSRPQSEETKEKLRAIMKARMEHERKQLTIMQDWKDVIAVAAKVGGHGDDQLDWDSYRILKEQLRNEYMKNKKKEKAKVRRSWSFEQRMRISQSIRAKWDDPEYRDKVIERMHETRHKGQKRRVPKAKVSDEEFDRILNMVTQTPTSSSKNSELSDPKIRSYNDPLLNEKLQKIRQIRARKTVESRTASENEISIQSPIAGATTTQESPLEAAERARILLAEAERAAKIAAQALEAVGSSDDALRHSLLEAKTLLDEANKSMLLEGFHI